MTRIPGHKPHWRNQARANPWHPDVNGVWAPNDGSPGWLAGLHAYEHGKVSFACCGNQTATGGVWAPNDGSPGWLAGKAEGCGCDATSGLWAPNDGSPGWLAGGIEQVKALDKNTWTQVFDHLDTTTKLPPKAVCTIMAWMGGASPNKYTAELWKNLNEGGLLLLTGAAPFWLAASAVGAAYHFAKTGKITTGDSIEDVCGKNAMDLEEAFVMAADPAYGGSKQLATHLLALGEGHHSKLIQQAKDQISEDQIKVIKYVPTVAINTIGNAAAAVADNIAGKIGAQAGISVTGLLVVGAAAFLYFKLK